MKQLLAYIKRFYSEEFDWRYTLFVFLLTVILLYFNYFFPDTNRIHKVERWKDTTVLYHFALYFIPLGVTLIGQKLFYPGDQLKFLSNYKFWLLVCVGVLIWSLRGGSAYFYNTYFVTASQRSTVESAAYYKIMFMFLKGSVVLVPMFIYWWATDRKNQPLYGLTKGELNLKPYLILLALLIPVIAIASQDAGFLKTYPRAQTINNLELFNPEHSKYFYTYESLYIFGFFLIELFFRGFMILAFLKFAGPKIILPTAVFYCCLHFGKPFPEALSSFFGGTALGIITYYSKSIWGGIIVHMGIAATMEICAYLTLLSLN